MRLNRGLFERKLHRLGYRTVQDRPIKKGDLRIGARTIDLYLHDLNLPERQREGFAVRLSFRGDTLAALKRLDKGPPVALLTLEPEQLGLFFGPEREKRELIAVEQLPLHLTHAVMAAEDSRFFEHFGLDWRGIGRALLANLRSGSIRQGGSTITQQLAKNIFLTPERTLAPNITESVLSLEMERPYD